MNDITKAKELLSATESTCVLVRGDEQYVSAHRGVAPLVAWLESKRSFTGACAADKVVGKATAFLYILLGVKAVYAHVISVSALKVLTEHGICTEYGEIVEYIINRRGDGICPFESAVMDITSPTLAYEKVRQKMSEMNIAIPSDI